jgi:O-antigen/teichoic acid export membrane protein
MARAAPSLGRATMASAAVDLVLAAATLLTTPVLVRALGTERYGVLGLVTVLASQLSMLQLGVGPALVRRLGEARGRGDGAAVRGALRAGAVLAVSSALAALGLALLLAPRAWTHAFQASAPVLRESLGAVPATAVLLGLQPLLAVALAALTGLERFAFLNGARLLHGTARLLAGVAAAAGGAGLDAVLLAQAATDVVMIAVAALAARAPAGSAPSLAWRQAAAGLLALGVPLSAAGVVAALLADGDKIALGALRSVADVAYYAVPANVVARLGALAGMTSVFLIPRLAATAAAGDTAEAARLAGRATRLGLCVTIVATAPLVAWAPELLTWWLGAAFAAESAPAARVLLVGLVANVSVYGAHAAIRARAHALTLAILYAVELPLFALLLWRLVGRWGVTGAALAWSIRVVLDAAAQHVLARRALGAPIVAPLLPILATLLLAGFAAACHLAGGAGMAMRAAVAAALALAALALLPAPDRDSLRRALWLPSSRGVV